MSDVMLGTLTKFATSQLKGVFDHKERLLLPLRQRNAIIITINRYHKERLLLPLP